MYQHPTDTMRAKSLFKVFPGEVPGSGWYDPFNLNMVGRYLPQYFDQDGYWEKTHHDAGSQEHFKVLKPGRWTLPYNLPVRRRAIYDWWAANLGGEEDDAWQGKYSDDDTDIDDEQCRQVPIQWEEKDNNNFVEEDPSIELKSPPGDHDPWIPGLKLTFKDKSELQECFMLSDKHVFAAQRLLRQQFPWVSGLQDTCLSQTKFSGVDSESVQIHHTRGNHWVVSSYLGGRLQVVDSIYSSLAKDLRKQLMEIYHSAADGPTLLVEIPAIPKQRGSRDCGLYAIAVAYELCQGNSVLGLEFQQDLMRDHLMECFQKGELTSFPQRRVAPDCDVTNFEEIEVD